MFERKQFTVVLCPKRNIKLELDLPEVLLANSTDCNHLNVLKAFQYGNVVFDRPMPGPDDSHSHARQTIVLQSTRQRPDRKKESPSRFGRTARLRQPADSTNGSRIIAMGLVSCQGNRSPFEDRSFMPT